MPKFARSPLESSQKLDLSDIPRESRSRFGLEEGARYALRQMIQPADLDSRTDQAEHASHKTQLKSQLKNFDKRFHTDFHPSLAHNTLKSIIDIHGPTGTRQTRDFLKGKIVGILLFSESERSERFMHVLDGFAKRKAPEFVVVAISQCSREKMHVSHQHGFYHLPQASNATQVLRDVGFVPSFFSPLPRLYIVDGTSGHCVSNNGVAAVLVRPDTAMAAWAGGFQGLEITDVIKARLML